MNQRSGQVGSGSRLGSGTRARIVGVAALALGAAVSFALGADTEAVVALRTALEVEQTLLREDTGRYSGLAARRTAAMNQLGEEYRALDAAVIAGQTGGVLQTILDRIEHAEAARDKLLATERAIVERIVERRRRIEMLEDRVAALEDRPGELMTGRWNVSLLPINQSGSFQLIQTGTLLSGTYKLEGGWTGSLQGTLVNRKVYLVRIDSKLGRSMELEGYLGSDGQRIRGTWLNYELAGQEGSTGQWSAVRQR